MLRGRAVATLVGCSQRVVLCYDMLHYGAVLRSVLQRVGSPQSSRRARGLGRLF